MQCWSNVVAIQNIVATMLQHHLKGLRHSCLVHWVNIAYDASSFVKDLGTRHKPTIYSVVKDRVTTLYQTNISPEAFYQTLQTTRMKLEKMFEANKVSKMAITFGCSLLQVCLSVPSFLLVVLLFIRSIPLMLFLCFN